MPKSKITSPSLVAKQSLWLFGSALLVLAPLMPHLPQWLVALTTLTLLWRGILLWRHLPLPSRWLLVFTGIAGAAGIGLHFHNLFGRDPGVALLVLLFSLKLLEMRTRRDGFAVVLLGFFLSLTQFFYAQSIVNAALTMAGVTFTTAALVVLNHWRQAPARTLRLAGLMLLQAIPFMLLLFVLFPRVQGPLWGLPIDAYGGLTGLSDSMTPGSISQLSQSEAIAFRVKFAGKYENKAPPQTTLYWRGPVLSQFDGRSWRIGRVFVSSRLPYQASGEAIDYVVTLEPHFKPWLFALEFPVSIPAEGLMASDYEILAKTPVRARLRYEMRSYPGIVTGADESPAILREALQLPPLSNPRARALAVRWRADFGVDDGAIVRSMIEFYRRQSFVYTLSPPLLGEHSVDEFLFDTRRGFCEHYSAGFVFMMRAAGIPARVVTGYQGGEVNPVDGTLVVRQSDAHAWAEVWLKGRGWMRVDPTAVIAPTRIELNLAQALPAGEARPLMALPGFVWLLQMRYRWDALANVWNQWVLGYNPQRQRDLLASLGMRSPDWQQMTVVLTVISGALLLGFTAWALYQRQRLVPAQAAWNRLSRMLARHGLARKPWEGPFDYAGRIAATLPPEKAALAIEAARIAEIYADLRYGENTPALAAELLQEMKMRISRIRRLEPLLPAGVSRV
ncbi:MAG: DUF3488 and transglutaminase-like domain-containing protein [Proteobacteria bacterium]|nr:DUF3488 and transglutaminase-like domain-containing protein [Pseudomonadota bacterium]